MSWRRIAVMALAMLGLVACTGSDTATASGTDAATETATTSSDDPTATVPPASEETVVVTAASEAGLIAAARAAFAAERGDMYLAWDDLGATVQGSMVQLRLCAWQGDEVYDSVLTVDYETSVANDGSIETRYLATNNVNDQCLNSELVATALAFIDEYDTYWTGVIEDPTSFDPAVRAPEIFTAGNLDGSVELVAGWVDDGVHWQGTSLSGDVIGSATQPLLWRRYEGRVESIFAIVSCQRIDPSYGLYRDDFLLDDFSGGLAEVGPDVINEYLLARVDGEWRVEGGNTLLWTDCLAGDTWLDGVNIWNPDPVLWQELPQP